MGPSILEGRYVVTSLLSWINRDVCSIIIRLDIGFIILYPLAYLMGLFTFSSFYDDFLGLVFCSLVVADADVETLTGG